MNLGLVFRKVRASRNARERDSSCIAFTFARVNFYDNQLGRIAAVICHVFVLLCVGVCMHVCTCDVTSGVDGHFVQIFCADKHFENGAKVGGSRVSSTASKIIAQTSRLPHIVLSHPFMMM